MVLGEELIGPAVEGDSAVREGVVEVEQDEHGAEATGSRATVTVTSLQHLEGARTIVPGDRHLLTRDGPELRVDALRNQRRILRAAARLLADDPAISMQRIAEEAAVARPTVYRRYPTREALVGAILQEATTEMLAAVREAVGDGRDPVTTLRQVIVALADIGASYPILLGTSGLQLHHRHGGGRADPRRAEAFAALDGVIERAQVEGHIKADLDPALLRQSILGALALSIRSKASSSSEVGELVAGLLLDGARPRT